VHKATDVRLGRIVRLLMSHAIVVVSGTKIAEEIGTSRSEVWRLIQQLRGLGVDVAGHPATGYQLRVVPDLLLPEMLAPSLKGTIFGGGRRGPQGLKPVSFQGPDGTAEAVPFPKPGTEALPHSSPAAEVVPSPKSGREAGAKYIHHYYKTGSTNSEAMLAAAAGAPEGSVFLAEEQLAGRGRGDHGWHSARSAGIYCSVVLRPAMPPADALIFSLAAGLAVGAAVGEIAPQLAVDLKWPNDLLLGGKKFCGILTEMNAEATRVRHLVVGVGINVNQVKFPAELREIATSLRIETGTEWSRVELCAALLKSLDREYRSLVEDAGAREAILRRFEESSSSVCGMRVSIEGNGGMAGVSEGLDERGFLRVRTAEGLRTVVSGTVRLIGNV
jgi:BirA family transcriptional regulator, biotin operon repressor / biotin---[acetyl-CoA-carboxylase] ligase